jgi:hypothetical protein
MNDYFGFVVDCHRERETASTVVYRPDSAGLRNSSLFIDKDWAHDCQLAERIRIHITPQE